MQQSLSLRWPLATVSAWWLSLLVKLFSLVCIHYTTLAPPHKAARQAFCSLRERGEIALVVCAAADGMSAPCVCAIQQQQFIKGEKGAAGVGLFSKQCIALL